MIWLDICDEQGNAIYFDIHHVERRRVERRWRHSVSGICGNGLFEVEVLVEPGAEGEVTFVDLNGGPGMRLDRNEKIRLEDGLLEAASQHCGLARASGYAGETSPHLDRLRVAQVNEPLPVWRLVS